MRTSYCVSVFYAKFRALCSFYFDGNLCICIEENYLNIKKDMVFL